MKAIEMPILIDCEGSSAVVMKKDFDLLAL